MKSSICMEVPCPTSHFLIGLLDWAMQDCYTLGYLHCQHRCELSGRLPPLKVISIPLKQGTTVCHIFLSHLVPTTNFSLIVN